MFCDQGETAEGQGWDNSCDDVRNHNNVVWNNIIDDDVRYVLLHPADYSSSNTNNSEESHHPHHQNPLFHPSPPPRSSSYFDQGVDHYGTPDQTRIKRIKYSHLSPLDVNQNHKLKDDQEIESHEESTSSLGLKLKKSPSLIDLVERRLSQGDCSNSNSPDNNHNNKRPNSKSTLDYGSLPMSEKLKASNFPALYLKIGNWERISQNEGDLVGKCYYAKKKLVWEILEGALKSKIEIHWSDIIGIRATMVEDEPGTLEIELDQRPSFFKETNPQPRKHTLWQPTDDFTGGEALIYRRHYVKFAPGALDKHYEKLLQCHPTLSSISQRPFPTQPSPYFRSHNNAYDLPSGFISHGWGSHLNPTWIPPNQLDLSNLRWSGLDQYTAAASLNNMMVAENGTTPVIFPNNFLPYEGLRRIVPPVASIGPHGYIENHKLCDNQMICSGEDIITQQDHMRSRQQHPLVLHDQLQMANMRAAAPGGMILQQVMVPENGSCDHTLVSLHGQHDYRNISQQQPLMNWEIVENLRLQQASIRGSHYYDQYH
ncbi:OLC1v1013546C1 [Oldenlandia corymbosa var. corymbosa]|uniref:OLC1v1013546C1 n=1 Tax=Oldenlandia corymbosa var. corymbosa TaxID=529605 RepID=A0AAV1E211_OLDCO|nr:OLC1v1013546C1 [Oldenlandia corymbosa var. corymbosa]